MTELKSGVGALNPATYATSTYMSHKGTNRLTEFQDFECGVGVVNTVTFAITSYISHKRNRRYKLNITHEPKSSGGPKPFYFCYQDIHLTKTKKHVN